MKFLILALAFCAANAASFYPNYQNKVPTPSRTFNKYGPSPVVVAKAVASSGPVAPAPVVFEPVVSKSVPAPVPFAPVPFVPKSNVDTNVEIVEDYKNVGPDGFEYNFKTADGTSAQSSGTLKTVGDNTYLTVKGTYRYFDESGKEVVVEYVADENGFQPRSDILPVGPEIPEAIARSLAYIASHPYYEEPVKKF